jgi:hypothetical protein
VKSGPGSDHPWPGATTVPQMGRGLQVATKGRKAPQAATRALRPIILRVRVTERLREELAKLAIEEHRTMSAMAEILLQQAIAERRKH